MNKLSITDISIEDQRDAWNLWNATTREVRVSEVSLRQASEIEVWLMHHGWRNLRILEVGCGTGWMCERLTQFGTVTGCDLSDEVLQRARAKYPQVTFLAGDFFSLPLPEATFDLIVTLDTLSHVADQRFFFKRLAQLLKRNGRLALATQNRLVFERSSQIGGPNPGQLRRWVDAGELRRLMVGSFVDIHLTSLSPAGDQGVLRLVNSYKLNRFVGSLLGEQRLNALKERALLGQSLLAFARRSEGQFDTPRGVH